MGLQTKNKVLNSYSMTGMADVIFLLLIFFMITSTLIAPNAVKVMLPQSNNQTQASSITTVSISPDLLFYIETTPVSINDLELALNQRLDNQKDPVISLHADRSVPYEHIFKVINIANKNKYKLLLATVPYDQ